MKTSLPLFLLLFGVTSLWGQNTIGLPDVVSYTKEAYRAGTQNWDIVQDKNGIIYFANNKGLLSFDGTYWKLYPLPNKTIVRSVAMGADKRLYVGGQNELGYFSPGNNGSLTYTSLKPLLSKNDFAFTDVWDIISFNNSVFFRAKNKIFQYSNNTITVYTAATEWRFLGLAHDQLIAQDAKNGLLTLKQGIWKPISKQPELPAGFLVTSLVPFGEDGALITTLKSGLHLLSGGQLLPFEMTHPNVLANELILSAVAVNADKIALGTNTGCWIINKAGAIVQHISSKEGLQHNTIVSLFLDRDKNLWLGLDNGIDFIAYNNAIKHIYPNRLNEGAGYASIVYDNKLYIGTSNGLFSVPIPEEKDLSFVKGSFKPVSNTKGAAWNLSELNGNLLLGHHEGAYLIKNGNAYPINTGTGYWNFYPYNDVLPSPLIIAGNYNGLDFLQYKNDAFVSMGNLPGFKAAGRFVTIDDDITWIAHPYMGVYKINLNKNSSQKIKLYAENKGLPALLKYLFKIKNRIIVTTEEGIYEYNAPTDSFKKSSYFGKFFQSGNIRYLKEDAGGNIWFVEDNDLGVIDFSEAEPRTIYFPELSNKIVSGFEHIYPYNPHNILVGAEKGFYHINYDQYKRNKQKIEIKIRMARAIGKTDSLLFDGYFENINSSTEQLKTSMPKIAHKWNSFHFEYSSPSYAYQSNVVYSYHLDGFDNTWSEWTKKAEKDYTNLPPGTYTFQVKAKSNLGNESAITHYSFTVLPPWYQSPLAYLGYTLSCFAIIYLLYKRQQKILAKQKEKHEEEQKHLQNLHQLELEKSEKEIVALRNEKLQAEVMFKNRELASVAMDLVQKGEMMAKIKEELMRLKKNLPSENASTDFKRIIRILNDEDKMEKEWGQFAIHFDSVHSDFLKTLKDAYPSLSANELKLSAYLRMNLSTKEIAQLMNISVRGVEVGRYRLRKKLLIPTETNLFDFLLQFSSLKRN